MRRKRDVRVWLGMALGLVVLASYGAGDDRDRSVRSIALADSEAQVRLIGDSAYQVSVDGVTFGRELPRSPLLRLRSGAFDPLLGMQAVPPALAASSAGTQAYLVQFVTPPLEGYRAEIERLGGKVHTYIPDQARIVLMPDSVRALVERLPYVRWVGPYAPAYKLDAPLHGLATLGAAAPPQRYSILVLEKGEPMQRAVAQRIARLGGAVEMTAFLGRRLEATLDPRQLLAVARMPEVLFIDRWAPPEPDMDIVRQVGGADFLETVQGYRGQGVRGEVQDGGLRATHQDFQAHKVLLHGANSASTGHGTSTYGQIFGSGVGSATARGMLPEGQGIFAVHSGDRAARTRELVNPRGPYRAVFQSNSWGSGLTTEYTTVSAELDDIAFDNDLLILQSQSNAGSRSSRPQAWAKNVLSVGALRHRNTLVKTDDAWAASASIGPATDGRIKPDLCQFFDSIRTTSASSDTGYTNSFGGTSAATPSTAGHAGLVFQMWADGVFSGGPGQGRDVFASRPHMTTAKALLINAASQYPFSGVGHDLTRVHQGWGLPDVRQLFELAQAAKWKLPLLVDESQVIQPREVHAFTVNVGVAAALKVTLVYADPAGSPSANRNRVNDLTLRVVAPDGTVYWGNNGLLAGVWSTPGGAANVVDTVENVFVQTPAPGAWRVEVRADQVVEDGHPETPALDADYALVATLPLRPSSR